MAGRETWMPPFAALRAFHAAARHGRFKDAAAELGVTESAVSHQLRRNKIKRQAPLTYISPEPTLGHFGIGGLPHGERLLQMFLRKEKIDAVLGTGAEA